MSKKTLYMNVLVAMTPSLQLPTTCCHAYKRIRSWLASGSIEERMA